MKVPGADNTLTIRAGANDAETIDIDLKQINHPKARFKFERAESGDVDSKAVTVDANLDITDLNKATQPLKQALCYNRYLAAIKDGKVYYDKVKVKTTMLKLPV